jgi:hypothetical protein
MRTRSCSVGSSGSRGLGFGQPRQAEEQGSPGRSLSENTSIIHSSAAIFGEFFAVEIIVIIYSTNHCLTGVCQAELRIPSFLQLL